MRRRRRRRRKILVLKVSVFCVVGIEWTRGAEKVHREPDDTFGGSVGCEDGQPVRAVERYGEEKAVKCVFVCVSPVHFL